MSEATPRYVCDFCPIRADATANPRTLKARMWRLHTRFCPMWNAYAKATDTPRPHDPADDKFLARVAGGIALLAVPLVLRRRRRPS
jgi:hypothetical protein